MLLYRYKISYIYYRLYNYSEKYSYHCVVIENRLPEMLIFGYISTVKFLIMKAIEFHYIVVYCDKKTGYRDYAIYYGTFERVYKVAKIQLSKENYILDIKRA